MINSRTIFIFAFEKNNYTLAYDRRTYSMCFKLNHRGITEILQYFFGQKLAEVVIRTLINNKFVEFITPYYRFNLISTDMDDNKFVDCAIAANAHYIVTNDHHFDVVKSTPFPSVDIIKLTDFSDLIKK